MIGEENRMGRATNQLAGGLQASADWPTTPISTGCDRRGVPVERRTAEVGATDEVAVV